MVADAALGGLSRDQPADWHAAFRAVWHPVRAASDGASG